MPEVWNSSNWNRAWNQPYSQPFRAASSDPTQAAAPPPPDNPLLSQAITGLLTPGLVPDIARMSAEAAGGRGIAGSPAGASTAVRMSEADWLQRLNLANALMSGEAARKLPYQITPYQALALKTQRDVANQTRSGHLPSINVSGGGGGSRTPAYGGGLGGLFGDLLGNSQFGSGGESWTLDDAYDWLGFGSMGSQEGDWMNAPQTADETYGFFGFEPPPDIPEFE